jgi:hypothetical protein
MRAMAALEDAFQLKFPEICQMAEAFLNPREIIIGDATVPGLGLFCLRPSIAALSAKVWLDGGYPMR